MARRASIEAQLAGLGPVGSDDVARRLVLEDRAAATRLVQQLERHLGADVLGRIERVWGLSGAEVARILGVSREAYRKWRVRLPADRAVPVAALDRATTTLLAKVVADRIPSVVRSPAPLLGERSLLEIAKSEGPEAVALAVDELFDLRRVQP